MQLHWVLSTRQISGCARASEIIFINAFQRVASGHEHTRRAGSSCGSLHHPLRGAPFGLPVGRRGEMNQIM